MLTGAAMALISLPPSSHHHYTNTTGRHLDDDDEEEEAPTQMHVMKLKYVSDAAFKCMHDVNNCVGHNIFLDDSSQWRGAPEAFGVLAARFSPPPPSSASLSLLSPSLRRQVVRRREALRSRDPGILAAGGWGTMAIVTQTPDILGERQSGQDVRTQNVMACQSVANIVKSSLGPVGLDKV
ncbi:hypothetical protein Taro_038562, partial [Colocasia esculenta]|nr:hypothetical protein [Colocasia esculenta]